MSIRKHLVAVGVLLVVLAATAAVAAHAWAQMTPQFNNRHSLPGTWWLTSGPPAERPFILTLNPSGTFTLEDSIDGGGHTFSGDSFSLTQGTWKRGPGRTAEALGVRFVYNADGKTEAVERVRLTLRWADGFERLEGTYAYEEMFCTEQATPLPLTVPACPDPSVAPTEVLRGPAPFTAGKIEVGVPFD